ncbi:MAG: DUF4173 domain-containing protein [Lachnospiraceae bacterium]|nr:DUF4173 domain-containing protein [Lachnospiraceae bacterium]
MDTNMDMNTDTYTYTDMDAGATIPEHARPLLEHFETFGVASIAYGLVLALCLYQNYVSFTLPFFAAVTIFYYGFCMRKLGRTIRKDSAFFAACILLLGVATACTDNDFFIFFNYVGMLLLLVTCLILNFYENGNLRFSYYFASILWVLFGSLGYLQYPFRSWRIFRNRSGRRTGKGRYVIYGLLISLPLLFVVMMLLTSADVVFRNIFEELFDLWTLPQHILGIGFLFALGAMGSFMILSNLVSNPDRRDTSAERRYEPIIAITFTSVLTACYLLFCFIQIFYLFLGNMVLPDGYTYAEYAREGFFQLLFVCILNLVIVLVCIGRFQDHVVLKVILSVFCACSFIMIASSAFRMILYIETYYLSLDRVLVLWSLGVISVLMILIGISIYKKHFPLFRYGVVVVSICYVLLSLSRPDTYIARYNIEAAALKFTQPDYWYLLRDLSADAAPVLDEYGLLRQVGRIRPGDENYYTEDDVPYDDYIDENLYFADKEYFDESDPYDHDITDYYYLYSRLLYKGSKMSLRKWNYSRYRGYQIAKRYSIDLE